MFRPHLAFGLAAVFVAAVTLSSAEPPPTANDKSEPPRPEKTLRERMRENQKKLIQTIDFDGISDPKTQFGDVLNDFEKRYDLVFEVNDRAFEADGLKDIRTMRIIGDGKPLRSMKGIRLDYAMRKILGQMPNPGSTTYINRGEYIEITTGLFCYSEIMRDPDRRGPESGARIQPALPIIHQSVVKLPLEEALRETAEGSFINIVLDSRCGEKARSIVTADFNEVPLDTAVDFLADMAGLKSVLLDNVLYVTTKENAKERQLEHRRRYNCDEQMREVSELAENDEQRALFHNTIRERRAQELEPASRDHRGKKAGAEQVQAQIRKLQAQIDEIRADLVKPK
jgi:hypothetical protein